MKAIILSKQEIWFLISQSMICSGDNRQGGWWERSKFEEKCLLEFF